MTKARALSVNTFIERYSKLVAGAPSPLWNDQRTHVLAALADGDWQWIATLYDRIENNTPPSLHLVRSDALFALALGRDPRSLDAFVTRVRRVPRVGSIMWASTWGSPARAQTDARSPSSPRPTRTEFVLQQPEGALVRFHHCFASTHAAAPFTW